MSSIGVLYTTASTCPIGGGKRTQVQDQLCGDNLIMDEHSDPVAHFRRRLLSEWLPAFCNDPTRAYGTAGFLEDSIRIGPIDAANFLRAIAGGLVEDVGGGRYRCAQSKALEQLFWEHEARKSPRPVTLWLEPIISIATLARLHYDFGWPEERLGTQTRDWAFDLAAYSSGEVPRPIVLCEVKKSRAEIDRLIADLQHHSSAQPGRALSGTARHVNSYRKWKALRRDRPAFLWVVGPEDYNSVFSLSHGDQTTTLTLGDCDLLCYERIAIPGHSAI